MLELAALIEGLAKSSGFLRKKDIQAPLRAFSWDPEKMLDPIGDDAAVLPSAGGYLLMSCDGILPELVKKEPYWAGYCAVLVSTSDIYAMGGRPTAITNLLSAPDEADGFFDCRRNGRGLPEVSNPDGWRPLSAWGGGRGGNLHSWKSKQAAPRLASGSRSVAYRSGRSGWKAIQGLPPMGLHQLSQSGDADGQVRAIA